MRDDYLWVEKYRPKTIDDCILPQQIKETFQTFVDQQNVPNLLLTGGPGVGKTSVAKAMLEQLDSDYIVVNGSMSGNIDTLRNDIKTFASSVSFSGGRKYVILDEADYLNAQSTQPALRNFMEEFSKNCGFILTCNFVNRIIEPLHSRCSVIHFKIPNKEKPKMAQSFFKRVMKILEDNNIQADQKVVAELLQMHFPDWRRVLNELQRYSVSGSIDSGILVSLSDDNFKALVQYIKDKNFTEMRKWVGLNSDNDSTSIFRLIYDNSSTYLKPNSIPQLVLILADYQHKAAFVADQEINLVACLTEMMAELEWK
jgi:replication factor C small subunit|tara:strand:- start:751 stop:1689 length:939 start_codon:yes stop_codon:yes gene_type:complete